MRLAELASAQIGERNNILFAASAALAGLGLPEGEILSSSQAGCRKHRSSQDGTVLDC